MAVLTPGKIRGLITTSSAGGIFTILAIDHRDSMRLVIDTAAPHEVPASTLTETKLWLLAELGSEATGVILDPEYSAAQAITARAISGRVGFLSAVEAQGYLGDPAARQTTLLDDWGVAKAKRIGASGIKLLVLYRPDSEVADEQDALITQVAADCATHDIPLFLEPVAYVTENGLSPDHPDFAAKRRSLVIESVRRLGALQPEILKVQFPVDTRFSQDRAQWADACIELNETSPVPWALLSGGDPYESFRDQVQIACEAGASGFMVGRALWKDAVTAPATERRSLIETELRPRFRELVTIAEELGRDWGAVHGGPVADENWYRSY